MAYYPPNNRNEILRGASRRARQSSLRTARPAPAPAMIAGDHSKSRTMGRKQQSMWGEDSVLYSPSD